ncbi:MAG TPA: TonB family protein [Chitinivibrionales bacterium]|nr:TonB family protein [Chitinivibrionales bacterium]
MRRSSACALASAAVHAAVLGTIAFAAVRFRESPVMVIDFSLEKPALPEPGKAPPARHRPPPVPPPAVVDKRESLPDTLRPDTTRPDTAWTPQPVIASADTTLAPAKSSIIDSAVVKKEYVSAQYGVIREKVYRALSYPAYAQEEGWQGTVRVGFLVNRDGSIQDVRVLASSGYKLLDDNAVKAVIRAAPLPRAPVTLEIILPVVYRLE